jgi:hypothetical protein
MMTSVVSKEDKGTSTTTTKKKDRQRRIGARGREKRLLQSMPKNYVDQYNLYMLLIPSYEKLVDCL